ncbi:MAG TPA: HDOD domain-containing protein [Bryobacteraceae bacterium]|nr:HDOD domain-containing protein [Bryobacteraceae bacterium]
MLPKSELERLLPAEPALANHCRRVSALALEIAGALLVPQRWLPVLEQSALLHHYPRVLFRPQAVGHLIADVFAKPGSLRPMPKHAFRNTLPETIEAVLSNFHSRPADGLTPNIRRLSSILELSNLLDEQLELLRFEPKPMSQVWAGLRELSGWIDPPVFEAARALFGAPQMDLSRVTQDLPVQATVAEEVFRALAGQRSCDVMFLSVLASRDPVLSGRLVQTANSALFSRNSAVRSVSQAISYIGTDVARKVLLAVALQPIFASVRLVHLWRHSVWMAQFCESLGHLTGFMDPEQALLLGLVHDVGRIAIQRAPRAAGITYARLSERGCPPAYVEKLLFGKDHGEIGAEILTAWNFPPDLIEAARFHHRPGESDSVGASALYAAEFWAESDEDFPALSNLRAALRRTGFNSTIFLQAAARRSSLCDLLRVA